MLVIGILSQLIVTCLKPGSWNSVLLSWMGMMCLIYSAVLTYNTYYPDLLNSGLGLYNGFYKVTTVTQWMDILVCLLGMLILGLTGFCCSKTDNLVQKHYLEYPAIGSFAIVGIQLLMGSLHMISLFLAVELQSFSLYILSSLYSSKFGLKYFLLGALSSCFILLGIALLYSYTGILSLDSLYVFYNQCPNSLYLDVAILILLSGFLFKIAVFPFHQWAVDIYDGVPTLITTWLSTLTKISILWVIFDFVSHCWGSWTSILVLLSFLSIVFGSILGLAQVWLKRLFVYSMICHVGFLLLALSLNTFWSVNAFVFYLVQYSLTNLNLFFILIAMGYYLKSPDSKDSSVVFINSLKGFFKINPWLAVCFAVSLLSLGGIPPFIGFFAKFYVLHAALVEGYLFVVVGALICSVVSLCYYLKIIKSVFFDSSDFSSLGSVKLSGYSISVISLLTCVISLFILYPNSLFL
uniref:NADH-ubiquinone oxidoreductase chain 2 n=1 Tax=Pneumocystis jirovecii TaxID=42068 RepID=A0A8E6Z8M4_PNEJI|nr:NADH dehydrogenase subunit 2 [Pneumocystis jirovecii]QVV24895.1 NADH dehydrogenase subunit 2 [Pneumocystis jirovecii]